MGKYLAAIFDRNLGKYLIEILRAEA